MAQLSFSCCASSLILLSSVCCSGLETLTLTGYQKGKKTQFAIGLMNCCHDRENNRWRGIRGGWRGFGCLGKTLAGYLIGWFALGQQVLMRKI